MVRPHSSRRRRGRRRHVVLVKQSGVFKESLRRPYVWASKIHDEKAPIMRFILLASFVPSSAHDAACPCRASKQQVGRCPFLPCARTHEPPTPTCQSNTLSPYPSAVYTPKRPHTKRCLVFRISSALLIIIRNFCISSRRRSTPESSTLDSPPHTFLNDSLKFRRPES